MRSRKAGSRPDGQDEGVASSTHPNAKRQLALALGCAVGLAAVLVIWRRPGDDRSGGSRDKGSLHADPSLYTFRVVQKYTHDRQAFTQGLLWLNGSFYESTGLYGRSGVREFVLGPPNGTRPRVSRVVRQGKIPAKDFGEGLVHVGAGELLQLTWRSNIGHRWNVQAGEHGHLKRMENGFKTPLGDGWGLEFDGTSLVATDSGTDIFLIDPKSMELRKRITVTDGGTPVEMLNELEIVEGELWANIFDKECIARVDLQTGVVTGWVDLTGILDRQASARAAKKRGVDPPDVMNGIAWDAESRRLFVTGKLWPLMFEVELVPSDMGLEEMRKRCLPTVNVFRQR
eukprot:TRINITY_DN20202_c0_g1_i1.p1 TRINITY_DN20202_c0_g1~~TRINITY_DN20202_c0_g1_i1.p1  ORF type:complete len:343 (-),score=25.44 TRINITY_DN20202_c0_g1_i1:771-1799(-)